MDKKKETSAASGKIWVSRHYADGTEETSEKRLEVHGFDVEPAYIKAGYGLTLNLGNYESARCDVGVTLPTYVEEIDGAFKKAWEIAEEEVQRQVDIVRKGK